MKKISLALFLSLLFHLSQYGLVLYWPAAKTPQNDPAPIDFEVIENKSEQKVKEKPIIKSIKSPNQANVNTPADFFAEETNRTLTQTRAQEYGQFRNNENKKQQQPSLDPKGDQFTQQLNMPSRSEYQLPNDIQYGNATNLNTDAHIYASFYNRVTDLFYIRWAQKLDSIWERLSLETKRSLSGRTWSTDVDIWLDPEGKYQKGLIMKKSGFSPFDSAAIFGFQDAGFFPNPPKAKVESDGHIHLRYRIFIQIR